MTGREPSKRRRRVPVVPYKAPELTPGESWTYNCPHPGCQVVTQGGRKGLADHKAVVHDGKLLK